MKKILLIAIALATSLTACNLVDDLFDWSNNGPEKEFASFEWAEIPCNVFTVKDKHLAEPTALAFPDTGRVLMCSDYASGKTSVVFDSFLVIDPPQRPSYWKEMKETWVVFGSHLYLAIKDIPFKVTDNGEITFSQKTFKGALNIISQYCDREGPRSLMECKVSISGKMNQDGIKDNIQYGTLMKGDYDIKLISSEGEHLRLIFKELTPRGMPEGYVDEYFKPVPTDQYLWD